MQVGQVLFLQFLWKPQNIYQMNSLQVKAVSLTKELNLDKQVLVIAVSANSKTMFKLGGTQKENAPQTIKSGKNEKIVQELLRAFSVVANPFTFDRTSDVNNKYPLMNIFSGIAMRDEDAEKLLQASLIGEQEIGKVVSKKFNSTITFFLKIKKLCYQYLYFRPVLLFNQL